MGLTPRRTAIAFVICGAVVALVGIALLSVPVALIACGVAIAALGLLAVEMPR
jgi:hypothetical protein